MYDIVLCMHVHCVLWVKQYGSMLHYICIYIMHIYDRILWKGVLYTHPILWHNLICKQTIILCQTFCHVIKYNEKEV